MIIKSIEEVGILDISELKRIVGGESDPDNKFIIREELRWDNAALREPYRANAAALVFCTGGEMEMMIGVRRFRLRKNTIMLYGPGNIIEVYNKTPDFAAGIMLITKDFIKGALLDLQAVMPIYKYMTEDSNDFLEIDDSEVALLKKYFALLSAVASRYGESTTFNLLASMLRAVSEMYARRIPETETPKSRTRQEEYFERFLMEVARHHKDERSVQFYADALHITPKYLSTVIKDVSGRSAAEWIDEFVIQEAKILLRHSSKSIQEITYHLNFSTQSFFGKYFKRHVGISPSQYRAEK